MSGVTAFRKLGQQFAGLKDGDGGTGEALRIAGDEGVHAGGQCTGQRQVVLQVVPRQGIGALQGRAIDEDDLEGRQTHRAAARALSRPTIRRAT